MQWQEPEIECPNCSQMTDYRNNYCSTNCEQDAIDKAMTYHSGDRSSKEGLPTLDDVIRGRDKKSMTSQEAKNIQLKRAAAKAEIIGDIGGAQRIRAMIQN